MRDRTGLDGQLRADCRLGLLRGEAVHDRLVREAPDPLDRGALEIHRAVRSLHRDTVKDDPLEPAYEALDRSFREKVDDLGDLPRAQIVRGFLAAAAAILAAHETLAGDGREQ